jgi:hypothetical protein
MAVEEALDILDITGRLLVPIQTNTGGFLLLPSPYNTESFFRTDHQSKEQRPHSTNKETRKR